MLFRTLQDDVYCTPQTILTPKIYFEVLFLTLCIYYVAWWLLHALTNFLKLTVTFPFGTHQMKVVSKGAPKQKYLIVMGGHSQIWNSRTRSSSVFCNESDKEKIRRNLWALSHAFLANPLLMITLPKEWTRTKYT